MTKVQMLDLIRRIADDVKMQTENTEFKLEDIKDLAEYEYEMMTK